jgi:hypothetical protein
MNNLTYGDVSHGSTCSPSSPLSSVFNSSSSNLFLRSSTSFLKLFQLQKKQLLSTEWRVPSVTTYSFWFGSASNDSNLGLSFSLSSRRLLRLINPPIIDLNKIAANSQMFTTEDINETIDEKLVFLLFLRWLKWWDKWMFSNRWWINFQLMQRARSNDDNGTEHEAQLWIEFAI